LLGQEQLDAYPAWKEYSSQDHALFVPSTGAEEILSLTN
jgi:hypothetical protein